MNPRNPTLKLIIYTLPLIFLALITIFNHKLPTTTTLNLTAGDHPLKCSYSDDLIANLEPLITVEPLENWEGLGEHEKNIKYLSTTINLAADHHGRRYIYVDVGARDYDSSIGSWFVNQYPKQNKTFEIFAVEADPAFHDEYMQYREVTLLPYAAWVRNGTVSFGSKPIMVRGEVWMWKPCGRIEMDEEGMPEVARVAAFDFVEWIKTTVRPEDFVVVKIDVEGTEVELYGVPF